MNNCKQKDKWLRNKRYLHLDIPYFGMSRRRLKNYVINKKNIVSHSFLPLIRRNIVSSPFKTNNAGKRVVKKKIRRLTFASHTDAAIFAYYAEILQNQYEKYIKKIDISDVVTAYRKIERDDKYGNKCNIDFAFDVFNFIRTHLKPENPLAVITFDIKGFFDNLDHKYLKDKWKQILNVNELSEDMYAVYKNTVKYAYVFENDIFNLFKDKIWCKTKSGNLKQKKVKRKYYLRNKDAIAYCSTKDIHEIRKTHLIHVRKYDKRIKGIPQGLPISATLANIYMIDFDRVVKEILKPVHGLYRRYSDDIIVVCPCDKGEKIRTLIQDKIKNVKLEIEERKTNLYSFVKSDDKTTCLHNKKGNKKVLEYLGFSFDGERILLKNSSVSKFYFKMQRSIRKAVYLSLHINNKTRGRLFERKLISRFTLAGAKTHRIYMRSINTKKFYLKEGIRSHGNYLTYILKSERIMGNPSIKRQLCRCSNKLNKRIQLAKVNIKNSMLYRIQRQIHLYGRKYD